MTGIQVIELRDVGRVEDSLNSLEGRNNIADTLEV